VTALLLVALVVVVSVSQPAALSQSQRWQQDRTQLNERAGRLKYVADDSRQYMFHAESAPAAQVILVDPRLSNEPGALIPPGIICSAVFAELVVLPRLFVRDGEGEIDGCTVPFNGCMCPPLLLRCCLQPQ
jgi:hypothetical protein